MTEAAPLIAKTRQRSSSTVIVTVDEYETARIVMNNCLAADVRLRYMGVEIAKLERMYREDYSDRTGAVALETMFAQTVLTPFSTYVPREERSGSGETV